jgi:hypothetical protein
MIVVVLVVAGPRAVREVVAARHGRSRSLATTRRRNSLRDVGERGLAAAGDAASALEI